jgi:hypothetical protein
LRIIKSDFRKLKGECAILGKRGLEVFAAHANSLAAHNLPKGIFSRQVAKFSEILVLTFASLREIFRFFGCGSAALALCAFKFQVQAVQAIQPQPLAELLRAPFNPSP